jgi:hypothetical protein
MESPSTPLILVVIGASIGLFLVALLRMVDIFKKRKENVTSFRAYSWIQVRCCSYATIAPPIQNKVKINDDNDQKIIVMRVETEPTTQAVLEKSLDIGQITIDTGHTSPNP